jgi:cysteine-rich repeat protein
MRRLFFVSASAFATALVAVVSCSVVNAPDDAVDPSGASGPGGSPGSGGQGQGGEVGPACGNGRVESGEDCDSGGDSTDCDADCTAVECGDGYPNLVGNEDCDDGNDVETDACTALCRPAVIAIDDDAAPADNEQGAFAWPDVTPLPMAGGFRVTWIDFNGAAGGGEAQVASLALDGTVSGQVPISTTTAGEDGPVALRMATNSRDESLVAWFSEAEGGLRYRRVAASGSAVGDADVLLESSEGEIALFPDVAAGANDGFCMLWSRNSDENEVVSCLDPDGELLPVETPLGILTINFIFGHHTIVPSQNGYVASFQDEDGDVVAQALSADGVVDDDRFVVSTLDEGVFVGKGFGSHDDAAFVIPFGVDALHGQAVPELRTLFRRFDDAAMPAAAETLISTIHKQEIFIHLGAGPTGRFAAVWTVQDLTAQNCSIQARLFEADGTPIGLPFAVSPPEAMVCHVLGRAAVSAEGDVAFTWVAIDVNEPAAFGAKVFAKIFPKKLAD